MSRLNRRGNGFEIEPEITERYRAGDIRHCYADTTMAKRLLGFRARTTIEAGMEELVTWLAEQEATDRVDDANAELLVRGLAR